MVSDRPHRPPQQGTPPGHEHPWNGAWTAGFIWPGKPKQAVGALGVTRSSEATDRVAFFRRSLTLEESPASAPMRVFADGRYVLFVNGSVVTRGPVRGQPRRRYYDRFDISPWLCSGTNWIAALVRHYGQPLPSWAPATPTMGLGSGGFVAEIAIADDLVVTDDSWSAAFSNAWTPQHERPMLGQLPEVLDGRLLPPNWIVGDDPHDGLLNWAPATVLRTVHTGAKRRFSPPVEPFGMLRASDLPPRSGETGDGIVTSLRMVNAPGRFDDPVLQVDSDMRADDLDGGGADSPTVVAVFDLGAIHSGVLEVGVDAPSGSEFSISIAEEADEHGVPMRGMQHHGFRYITRGGEDTFWSIDPVGARYVTVSARVAHDSTVNGADADVTAVRVHGLTHPVGDGPRFNCDDERLNEIFRIGRRTVTLCSLDAYVDCPTREQRAWTGDAVVHQMVDLLSSSDWSMARHHLVLSASPRADGMLPMAVAGDIEASDMTSIPDWALHWVRSVHNLMRWTGDSELVSELLPVAELVVRWFAPYQGSDGLLSQLSGWTLVDWATLPTDGVSAAENALWVRALRDVEEMAIWLGQAGTAAWCSARISSVHRGFEKFWSPSLGAYTDRLPADGASTLSQHTNALAIVAGLAAPERHASLIEVLSDQARLIRHSNVMGAGQPSGAIMRPYPEPLPWAGTNQVLAAEPFFRYVVHDALAEAGAADRIADACLDWWPWVQAGETSWPETWHGGTHCHGWSSTPTRDLLLYVLGVSPAAPGYERARIAPRLGRLCWAEGSVPTPHGLITVRVEGDTIEVDSPVPYDLA
jgi:alpha-L-rhamnosidase